MRMAALHRLHLFALAAVFLFVLSPNLRADDAGEDDAPVIKTMPEDSPGDTVDFETLPADIPFASAGYDGVSYYYWLACCNPLGDETNYHFGFLTSDNEVQFDENNPCGVYHHGMTKEELDEFLRNRVQPDFRFIQEPKHPSIHTDGDDNLHPLMFHGLRGSARSGQSRPQRMSPCEANPNVPIAVEVTSDDVDLEILKRKTFVLYKIPIAIDRFPEAELDGDTVRNQHAYVLSEAHPNIFDPEKFSGTRATVRLELVDRKSGRARRTDAQGKPTSTNGPLFVAKMSVAAGAFQVDEEQVPLYADVEEQFTVYVYVITFTPEFGHPG